MMQLHHNPLYSQGFPNTFGLTVVVLPKPDTQDTPQPGEIRLTVERDIISNGQNFGLGFPKKPATSLWAGSTEEIRAVRARYRAEFTCNKPSVRVTELGEYECNWLEGAGYQTVNKHVDERTGLVTLFYECSDVLSPIAAANLGKLRAKATSLGCQVVIFLIPQGKLAEASLKGMVDKLIVLELCEPDPNWRWAVSVSHVSQGYFSSVRGKVMCQLSPVQNAFPEVVFEPFLNSEAKVRIQWHMNQAGAGLKKIGETFGVHPSTISRKLSGLPKTQKTWLSDDKIEELLGYVLGDQLRKVETATPEEVEEDDDFDLDDDDIIKPPKH